MDKDKCKSKIVFGDDFGDNDCTFHCQLEKNHKGKHRETGTMSEQKYILEWEGEHKSWEELYKT